MHPVLAVAETNGIHAALSATLDWLKGSSALCTHLLKF